MTLNMMCLFVFAVSCAIVIIPRVETMHSKAQLATERQTDEYPFHITSNMTRKSLVSSVWCHTNGYRKSCTFQNLCYVPLEKQFIFILSNNSIISGVTNINDLKTIELSSVTNHNGFIMKLIVATKDNAILRRNLITVARGFILWRFKWDNIMHVIHDDLLPLYTTYENICTGNVHKCASKYHVAFADEGELGPLSEWYNIFSRSEPIILHRGGRNNIICFEEGQTGLNGDSVWFQYGFGIPQGPIADTRITRNKLRQFSEFVVDKFKVPISQNLRSINIVFFSRKINRKILNEDSVLKTIEDVYREIFPNSSKLRILNVDFTTNDTRHILSCLLQSQIVVGMHGSAMILTIFLKPGSVIIELFPFGINPQHVSPVKAICDLPDIGLIYNSWSNSEVENTVTYADAPPLLGGISHLSVAEQEQITSISDIPAVKCCHNPAYLYRMFQDTVVGEDFNVVLKTAFLKQKRFSIQVFNENSMSHMLSQWYFPAPVSNIMCTYSSYDRMVMVTWIPPPNTKDPEYRISVVTSVLQFSTNSMQPEVKILLPHSVHGDTTIDLWVKSVEQGQDSLDTYMQCKIHASEY